MDLTSIFSAVKEASVELSQLSDSKVNEILISLSVHTVRETKRILAANAIDMAKMDPNDPKRDRLKLDKKRIAEIADGIRNVANLPSPVGRVLSEKVCDNGMTLKKVSVPFGVIGVIYEARPNVSLDVFSLCFKSGNCCILKGGSDAQATNEVIVDVIHKVLTRYHVNTHVVELLPPGHESATELMHATKYVDLIIPRGGSGLINYVRENSKVPIIETGAGICHTYFDLYGYTGYGEEVIFNAKTRRVSVCNALDCLIIHKERLSELPQLCAKLATKQVIIYADKPAYEALKDKYPSKLLEHATPDSYGTEFLDYKMAIKTVDSFADAIGHISQYSSHHSECIITENKRYAEMFRRMVDAACIYTNVSTAFTDGGQFGLGAEIGISTQKLHARGPMGLEEINTYKWVIEGKGQTRWPDEKDSIYNYKRNRI